MTALAVFCASSERIDPRHVRLAEQVGAAVAARGWTLVSGGGSVSCMGAVARAARAGGGRTVGVIPRALLAQEVADHGADELVVTDDIRTRKAAMDARADAFLALPGGLGTLEELVEVWTARTLGLHDRPVVVLDPDGVLAPLRELVASLTHAGFVRPAARDAVRWETDVPAALAGIESALGTRAAPARPRPEEVLEAEA